MSQSRWPGPSARRCGRRSRTSTVRNPSPTWRRARKTSSSCMTAPDSHAPPAERPSNGSSRAVEARSIVHRASRAGGRATRDLAVGAPRPASVGGVRLPGASALRAGGGPCGLVEWRVARRHGTSLFALPSVRPHLAGVQIVPERLSAAEEERAAHREALRLLQEQGFAPLVGGAYALKTHPGIWRDTKDLDL